MPRARSLVKSGLFLAALLSACGTRYSDPISSAAIEAAGSIAVEPNGGMANQPDGAGGMGGAPELCATEWVAHFDGASFATAPRPVQDDFTIEAWISTASSPQGGVFGEGSALVFADVEKIQASDFAAAILNDKFLFSVGMPDTPAISTTAVTTGKWLHVAATRNRTTGILMVFVNGVLEGSAVGSTQALADEPSIQIGGRPGRNFYSGSMSDLRIWSLVRSQSEILSNMRHRLSGGEPGLVGYYRLDEQDGLVAHDSAAGHHDAALSGSPVWRQESSPFCEP
jgi:hypothetical protein